MEARQPDYYQAGGSLPYDAQSYVKRCADDNLYHELKAGNFCAILTARQMGKSSLRVRAMRRLEDEGYACVAVDLTQIGSQNVTPEQWYSSLQNHISRGLKIRHKYTEWKSTQPEGTPIDRFVEFVSSLLLREIDKPIVIFIDEIDSVLSLATEQFSTDDFFAAIRSFYNARADRPEFQRLNFALFGVAAPNDLMKDQTRTPFNIGRLIPLQNFTLEEARTGLLEGLKYLNASEQKLLKEIFKYTSGQPYLTQTLCMQVFRYPCIPDEKLVVAGLVDTLFLDGEYPDDHLSSIDERIWRNKHCRLRMLHIYQALFNQHRIKSNPADPAQIYLKLSGLVVESNGFLRIANLIYEKYFNHDWVTHKLNCLERPFAKELQRWIDSGKKGDTALQGDQLQKAIAWKEERDDLSKLERDFIEFSSHVTYRKRSAIYRLERLQNRILRSFVIMISLFVISLLMGVVLYRGYASRDNNDVRLQKAEDNADQLIQELEKVRKDLEKSQSSLDSLHHVFQDSLITLQRKLQKSNVTQQRYQRQATWLKSQLHSVQNDTVAIINYLRRLKGSLTPPDTTGTIHRKDTLSTSLSRKTAHK